MQILIDKFENYIKNKFKFSNLSVCKIDEFYNLWKKCWFLVSDNIRLLKTR